MRLPVFNRLEGKPVDQAEHLAVARGLRLVIGEEDGQLVRLSPPQPGEVMVAVENGIVVRVFSLPPTSS